MRIEIHPDYIKYEDFLKSIPTIFKNEGKTIYNGRNCVKLFSINGADFVVKRYKRPNIVQSISYSFFKKSKAERAFIYADYFKKNGINTPQGICFIEIKKHLLLAESYFISAVCNMPSLINVLNCDDFDQKLAKELAAFLVYMHSRKILHGDLNLSNILFNKEADKPTEFILIDTNRSVIGKNFSKNDYLANLIRLTHNRKLLKFIILEYTSLRCWNYEKSSSFVFRKLDSFEKRKFFKKKMKSILHFRKSVNENNILHNFF